MENTIGSCKTKVGTKTRKRKKPAKKKVRKKEKLIRR